MHRRRHPRRDRSAEAQDEKIKLLAKPAAAVQKVIDSTRAIEALTTTDAAMLDIDRGTDRSIAGFHDELDAIERCLDRGDILPLTEARSARLADASTVRGTLLADGTYFLKLPPAVGPHVHHGQSHGRAARRRRHRAPRPHPRSRPCQVLGRPLGAKLGVTETKSVDPAARAIDAWHEAMGELMVRVHDAYDDPNDPTHTKVREALTAPYHLQVEEERKADQKARAKRKGQESPVG